jgi:DNA invertase Pin-like site-specific DNA recombinase
VFTDYASGRDTHRPGLDQCLHYVREGDTLVVHSMDRLARNLDDLRRLVRDLTARGVGSPICSSYGSGPCWCRSALRLP